MKKLLLSAALLALGAATASAKIWRVSNRAGADPDFTDLSVAVANASVLSGDTIHVEPSATAYSSGVALPAAKALTIIGNGYLHGAALGDNAGLAADTLESRVVTISFPNSTAAGATRFIGIVVTNVVSPSGSGTINANLVFEKCRFESNWPQNFGSNTINNFTLRKCMFTAGVNTGTAVTLNNFVVENCIWSGDNGSLNMNVLYLQPGAGTGNVFRNNTVKLASDARLHNFYVANNIFITNSPNTVHSFTGSNVKNNLFNQSSAVQSPAIPAGGTGNQFGVTESNVFTLTGSSDGRYTLKSGSPAIAAGVTVGTVTTPDAGAFGGPDPYKLSGVPGIPTIYSITLPISIPQGQATMTVNFSTRSNN